MTIKATDTTVILQEGTLRHTLLEKPEFPDYSNVTAMPHFTYYYTEGETIWDRLSLNMTRFVDFCRDDLYLGCYALILRRLYPLLLSDNRAKNLAAYGADTDCMAYRVIQDFMTFLHKGNALTALALSPFSLTAVSPGSCTAMLYRLDACPAPAAVCDAINRIKPGGLLLLYTIKQALPAELTALCTQAQKDNFGSCTLYTLTVDDALMDFARANGSESFILLRAAEITRRVNDLQNLIQAMLAGAALPGDAYFIAVTILQQTEEILLSLYDYLEDDGLPVRANALKESVLNYYVGVCRQCDLTSYREKLTQFSEIFFDAVGKEFPQ
ncbi:MAG: hypothetical protein K2H37_12875 [Lachnospiraceae bacterium]|nr:hypothetical protein [Lachnospiraceae bacterium]